jgi:hypothetical protein
MNSMQIFRLCLVAWLCVAGPTPHAAARAPQQSQSPAQPTPEAKPGAEDQQPLNLSDEIIQQVLEPLRTGLETQDIDQVLSVFDRQEMPSYTHLRGQLKAFFDQFNEVNFRYQILQATADKDHASATAEIDMDALPYGATVVPSRRSVQMRFRLKQESKGWKIVSFTPSDFFSVNLNPSSLVQ